MGKSYSKWKRACIGCIVLAVFASVQCRSPERRNTMDFMGNADLRIGVDRATGLPAVITSRLEGRERIWLLGPVALFMSDEATQEKVNLSSVSAYPAPMGVSLSSNIDVENSSAVWEMTFSSDKKRTGYEIELALPVVFPEARIFTPSHYGVMDAEAYPTFEPAAYATYDWNGGRSYVLPLVSIMDPSSDCALTLALPAVDNIPHFQVSWSDARVLRLRMGHRGIGGGTPLTLRLLVYVHPADYRSALKAYADDFPAYFRPPLPRGPFEGAFWYHHILEHPDFVEMARQRIRFIWTSFWFTYLGDYLPSAEEWYPYTYARWWNAKQKMSDDTINAFIRKMHDHGIGTYAYFNVTEYGGRGGEHGDAADADRVLDEQLGPALVRNAEGRIIPTWEGAKAINPGRDYPYRAFLREQILRHMARLPELDGFIVDRLDWASGFDYGRHDGLSMIEDRPVENLAVPVADALQELCRLSHEAGKRVFVNQFWRVELVRDTDGYCHESDYLPGMAYLAPYRPASAWHQRTNYSGDLLSFEAQMKRRLHWALFPQMIAHEYPISQQPPNARAADVMEIFAPLFEPLMGKEQVLIPHCVSITGPNEANLFRNGMGHYVASVTSRVRFLCRPPRVTERAELTISTPDAAGLTWAHVYSADVQPYRAPVEIHEGTAKVELERHGSSSMVVAGKGPEPPLEDGDAERLDVLREQLFPDVAKRESASARPDVADVAEIELQVSGTPVGTSYPSSVIHVYVDNRKAGEIRDTRGWFKLTEASEELPERPPVVSLVPGDEGTWLAPENMELVAWTRDGSGFHVASWVPGDACGSEGILGMRLPMSWREPKPVARARARFEAKDDRTGGSWKGSYGALACWTPGVREGEEQSGFRMQINQGRGYTWTDGIKGDPRLLEHQADPDYPRRAACWFDPECVEIRIDPPDDSPYCLTVYLLDYDRNGRAQKVIVSSGQRILDEREVLAEEMERGVYLSWESVGSVVIRFRKGTGANAVISGVFADRQD